MIEVVQTALITYELFRSFATNFEDVAAFSDELVQQFLSSVGSLATTQGSLSIVAGAQARTVGDVSHLQEKTDIGTTMWQAGSALCDVMIAISLLATVAVTDLILYLVFPHSNFHIAPALVLAKPYSNTLLVMLNSRMHVSTHGMTQPLPDILGGQR
ncbi:hypothetical protein EDD18DRAFT_1110237 [Armillaria luteobubalina]|uniref:Uncharacterized protein n=1 Tax=Armillaria luteobubalina TaxID=153913 RepID=A0AA39PSC0_9AGAR|nr:hypothetical protein EDD18DRAFT_1110237 [Armillaria luteobubalina]